MMKVLCGCLPLTIVLSLLMESILQSWNELFREYD